MRRHFLFVALAALAAAGPAAAQAPAPDVDFSKLRDYRQNPGFKMLDDPKMVPAAQADFMEDGDYVLGIALHGEARAYPIRFMAWHHGANDRIKDTPYSITYCIVCNTGVAYDQRLEGKERPLAFYGLYNGVVVLCDRETESVFLQVDGRYVNGPLSGKRLRTIPLLDTTWGQWKKLHPETGVMSPDTPFKQFYRPPGFAPRATRERLSPMFIQSMTHGDLRLSPFERLLGVALTPSQDVDDKTKFRAYPLKAVNEAGGVVNETVEGLDVAVVVDPVSQAPVAFLRTLEGQKLTLQARKDAAGGFAVFDKETGTRWSLTGRGEEGSLAGKQLTRLRAHLSLWYGWVAYFPQSSIYGSEEPPKPGNPFAR